MMIICNSSGSTSRNDSATRGTTTTTNYSQHAESRTAKHAGVNSQWLCHERGVDPTSIVSGKEESSSSSQFLTEYEIKYFICHLLVPCMPQESCIVMSKATQCAD